MSSHDSLLLDGLLPEGRFANRCGKALGLGNDRGYRVANGFVSGKSLIVMVIVATQSLGVKIPSGGEMQKLGSAV